jgi:hypothetical protein
LLDLGAQERRELLVTRLFGLAEAQFEVGFTASELGGGSRTAASSVQAEDGKVDGEKSSHGAL